MLIRLLKKTKYIPKLSAGYSTQMQFMTISADTMKQIFRSEISTIRLESFKMIINKLRLTQLDVLRVYMNLLLTSEKAEQTKTTIKKVIDRPKKKRHLHISDPETAVYL